MKRVQFMRKGRRSVEKLIINGGNPLGGKIRIQGSKNGALPILAATVLARGESVIHNCPQLTDVDAAVDILRYLGCGVTRQGDTVTVDSGVISRYDIPERLMREMRSSIVFLGSIIGRMGRARLFAPGGCEIGLRPIDLHLSSLMQLGVTVNDSRGEIVCEAPDGLSGAKISLSFPSVGATENIMLAAAVSNGTTTVLNAAREPEIDDLAVFLNSCGARVHTDGSGTVVIHGVEGLHGAEHTVIPDRIAAATVMSAVGAAGGDVLIESVVPHHLMPVMDVFDQAGCTVHTAKDFIRIISRGRPKMLRNVRTMPYPGFPTDAQAPVMAMACVAQGTSVIVENIFESRFKHVGELVRLGAKIKVEGRVAVIDGVERLYGAKAVATDLRGGSAIVVAGLTACGVTEISGVAHIDRGYERLERSFSSLGADIQRIKEGSATGSKL